MCCKLLLRPSLHSVFLKYVQPYLSRAAECIFYHPTSIFLFQKNITESFWLQQKLFLLQKRKCMINVLQFCMKTFSKYSLSKELSTRFVQSSFSVFQYFCSKICYRVVLATRVSRKTLFLNFASPS